MRRLTTILCGLAAASACPTATAVLSAQVAAGSAEARIAATGAGVAPVAPKLDLVLEALVETGTFTAAGKYDGQDRGFLAILGGTFAGPDIKGKVLPSYRDWPRYFPNGARTTEVDYIYRTDDGTLLFVSVDGWRYGKLTGPLADYEKAHPGNLLRAFVKIRAPDDSRYAWMNYQLFYAVAGTAVVTPQGPRSRIRIYRLS